MSAHQKSRQGAREREKRWVVRKSSVRSRRSLVAGAGAGRVMLGRGRIAVTPSCSVPSQQREQG